MGENFVTKEVCELKHKEVDEVKQDLKAIKNWLYTLMGAAILNLVLMLIRGGVK